MQGDTSTGAPTSRPRSKKARWGRPPRRRWRRRGALVWRPRARWAAA